ncbi:hypothetical protein F4859DRAFT_479023 [Xylaria cf. heliscus]|nr:hypothetical protein F4859DRAFT_479023 [Xylaria cf. heliscus]
MSPNTSPIIRHPYTGCFATLSASLVPSHITHNAARCKCIVVTRPNSPSSFSNDGDREREKEREMMTRMAINMQCAVEDGSLESEKPALEFAMLLLGARVVDAA